MPSSTDVEELLRCADPALEPTGMDELDALLAQAAAITATPPPARRRPRRLLIAVPLAVAAVVALLFALPIALHHGADSLVARAYAQTDPGDEIVHEVALMTIPPGEGGPITATFESWLRPSDGSARSVQSAAGHWAETVHDANGVMYLKTSDGTTETIAPDSEAARQRMDWTRSVTLTFRRDYEDKQLHDDGMTTLEGRPVHAYSSGPDTWYIDPDTALPVGQQAMVSTPPDPTWRPVTMVIKTYEKLPATPENLAKLR